MARTILTGLSLVASGCQLLAGMPAPLHARASIDPLNVLATQHAAQSGRAPLVHFAFDGTISDATGTSAMKAVGGMASFERGLEDQALSVGASSSAAHLTLDGDGLPFDASHDFSVQFWMRTVAEADQRFAVLSQKDFRDNSLASQKRTGWVFYVSGGNWAWNMGSGDRRITYERDNDWSAESST